MNILMMVSWYTKKGQDKLEAGVFHYEQSMDLNQYCNMAIYYPFDTDMEDSFSSEEEWGLQTYRSPYRPHAFFKNRKFMDEAMEKIIKDFKPDIIHAHVGSSAGYYAVRYSKKYNIPMVITEHTPIEISGVDKPGINHYFSKIAFRQSKANICVSKDSQQKLAQIYKDCRFDVIYNGIILPDYNMGCRNYYKDGYLNIVIVAVLYDLEIKGLKYLLQAIKNLKDKGEKVYLHHIGGGQYLDYFINLAKELGIEDVVTFYGRCERKQLYEIVSEMDFFVSASLMECSGVSVQEAMLLGKPVLGTNSGGVDSLVPQQAGHIVEKASAKALEEGILYMKDNLDAYDRDSIKQYAYDSFEIDHISKKYLKLYESVFRGDAKDE